VGRVAIHQKRRGCQTPQTHDSQLHAYLCVFTVVGENDDIELVEDQTDKLISQEFQLTLSKEKERQLTLQKRLKVQQDESIPPAFQNPQTFYSINLDSWENRIVWDGDDIKQLYPH
jgi:hypothetical protein